MRCGPALVVALLVQPLPTRAADSSFRCDGGIVELGDARLDLLARCGRPALVEQVELGRTVVDVVEGEVTAIATRAVERWTYNPGPRQLIRIVTLRDGKVVAIETGGYGYEPELLRDRGSPRARCEPAELHPGDAKLDLLARCGAPAAREVRAERRPVFTDATPPVLLGHRVVDVEVWTYDFGPRRFRAIVTLEDGKVAGVERGDYGSAP